MPARFSFWALLLSGSSHLATQVPPKMEGRTKDDAGKKPMPGLWFNENPVPPQPSLPSQRPQYGRRLHEDGNNSSGSGVLNPKPPIANLETNTKLISSTPTQAKAQVLAACARHSSKPHKRSMCRVASKAGAPPQALSSKPCPKAHLLCSKRNVMENVSSLRHLGKSRPNKASPPSTITSSQCSPSRRSWILLSAPQEQSTQRASTT